MVEQEQIIQNKRILVVDDEPDITKILSLKIKRHVENCEVFIGKNGKEAIEVLSQQSIDVCITDINMPFISGLELIKYINDQNYQPQIPIIVITAKDEKDIIKQCIKLGAYDYIEKPFTDIELLISVQRAIEKRYSALSLLHYQTQLEDTNIRLNQTLRELQEKESLLIQSEKLITIGQIAANIAHETNTPLTAITGFATMLKEYLSQNLISEKQLKYTDNILRGCERIQFIVSSLQEFTTQEIESSYETFDLSTLIRSILTELEMLGLETLPQIHLAMSEPLSMKGIQKQIEQMFFSLFLRSYEAKADNISLQFEKSDSEFIIVYEDNAKRSQNSDLKIYQQASITKGHHLATRLGITYVYHVTQIHKGTIQIHIDNQQGTLITIRIPQ